MPPFFYIQAQNASTNQGFFSTLLAGRRDLAFEGARPILVTPVRTRGTSCNPTTTHLAGRAGRWRCTAATQSRRSA